MTETNFLTQNQGDEVDDLDISSEVSFDTDLKDSSSADDFVSVSKTKLAMVNSLLLTIKESQEKIAQLLSSDLDPSLEARISIGQSSASPTDTASENGEGRIIEGVFDGENMIGPDGKQYSVPANYASKSKLVEGDILKLTITAKGTFVYKQIGPIERSRVVGDLKQSEGGSFIVESEGKIWKVLTASVTYYKGKDGDEIVILVPKVGDSKWAAVENIVRKTL